jgi:hypothetical protein
MRAGRREEEDGTHGLLVLKRGAGGASVYLAAGNPGGPGGGTAQPRLLIWRREIRADLASGGGKFGRTWHGSEEGEHEN